MDRWIAGRRQSFPCGQLIGLAEAELDWPAAQSSKLSLAVRREIAAEAANPGYGAFG